MCRVLQRELQSFECSTPSRRWRSPRESSRAGSFHIQRRTRGFFGKGIYFSPDYDYVRNVYYANHMKSWDGVTERLRPVILCCYVAVCHVFPVIDLSYRGTKEHGIANRGGYDMHVAVVQCASVTGSSMNYIPTRPTRWDVSPDYPAYIEVVVFNYNQILPVAIVVP